MTRLVKCKEGMLRTKRVNKYAFNVSTQRNQKQMEQKSSYRTWLSLNRKCQQRDILNATPKKEEEKRYKTTNDIGNQNAPPGTKC